VPLFKVKEGERYSKEEIVSLCLAYIYSPEFKGNVTEKEQKISLISAKQGECIEFQSRGKGWGESTMNPNCWIEVRSKSGAASRETPQSISPQNIAPNAHIPRSDLLVRTEAQKPDSMSSSGSSARKSANGNSEAQYNQRPWQASYRNELLRIWGACAVTGCRTPSLLTASHIKPVIHCTEEEKTDPYNGILLSKVYDALFDRGLISFHDDGKIIISKTVPEDDLRALGIDRGIIIRLDPRQFPYLRFHREKILK